MFTSKVMGAAFAVAVSSSAVLAEAPIASLGTPVTAEELSKFFAVQPGGAGLPAGSGTVDAGRTIYAEKCSFCHGEKLEGIPEAAGPALIGGRGSLMSAKPLQTVESYWPYATTLYDYVWRAMPFDRPGSLTADEVFSLVAYVLTEGKVIKSEKLDADALSKVVMPNAQGFYAALGPDLRIYRDSELMGRQK